LVYITDEVVMKVDQIHLVEGLGIYDERRVSHDPTFSTTKLRNSRSTVVPIFSISELARASNIGMILINSSLLGD